MENLYKPKDRGFIAYAHTTRVATTYQQWPKEAYEANRAKIPILWVLSYIQHIPGAQVDHIPSLQEPNHIATCMRAATREVDEYLVSRREHIPTNLSSKDYARHVLRSLATPEPMPTTRVLG